MLSAEPLEAEPHALQSGEALGLALLGTDHSCLDLGDLLGVGTPQGVVDRELLATGIDDELHAVVEMEVRLGVALAAHLLLFVLAVGV